MKKIGFLSFGHWTPSPQSQTRSAGDALLQSIELAVAAEELGADGAYFRVHHFARQLSAPFPLLAAIGAKTRRIEIGTGVIDMRYENPLYMAEDAGAADLIAGGRLQLGISRGARPSRSSMAGAISATCRPKARPKPTWPASTPRSCWTCSRAMASPSPTRARCSRTRPACCAWSRTPRVSVSRSIFALVNDQDRLYFGRSGQDGDQIGFIDDRTQAIFGRSYAAEPETLVRQLAQDEAIAEADTLLLTVPNQLGVDYNVHVIETVLQQVAPALGWR